MSGKESVADGSDVPVHSVADFAQVKSPEWLEKQPFGQMPYLEDGDFVVFESRAIAKCQSIPIGRHEADEQTLLSSLTPLCSPSSPMPRPTLCSSRPALSRWPISRQTSAVSFGSSTSNSMGPVSIELTLQAAQSWGA